MTYNRDDWNEGDIAFVVHDNVRRGSGACVRILVGPDTSRHLNRRGAFTSTDLMWVGTTGYIPADDPRIVSAERLIVRSEEPVVVGLDLTRYSTDGLTTTYATTATLTSDNLPF